MVEANYQTFSGDVDITSNLSADTNTFFVDSVTNRVGIGNTTPSTSLDVSGEVKISDDLKINTTTFVVDASEDKVSINKATPSYTLDVGGDINLDSTNHVIRSGGSSVIRFNSAFNVGIGGAADTTNKFKVNGNIQGTNLIATNLKLNNGGHIFHNGNNVIRFSADRVGIGGEPDSNYRLKINGDIKATNFRGALVGNADTSTNCSGNAATSDNCSGNAATSDNCTGNAATSTNTTGNAATSSNCTGNAATSSNTTGNAATSTSCNGNAATSSNTTGSSTSCNGNAATSSNCNGNAATSDNCSGNAATSDNTAGSSTSCNGNAATSTNCANAANTNGSSSTNFSCYALTASNNVTAYSDRRLKENIKPIENALDKVCQIGGYTFTRNDLKDSKKRHAGIIAQELMEVLPEVVEGTYETKYSVAYGNIIALLIEAIKELKHDVDQLK